MVERRYLGKATYLYVKGMVWTYYKNSGKYLLEVDLVLYVKKMGIGKAYEAMIWVTQGGNRRQ